MLIGSRGRGAAAAALLGATTMTAAGCAIGSQKEARRSTATALAPVAQEVHDHIARVWPQSARIWPGTVLKDRRIVLGDGTSGRLVSVDGVSTLSAATLASKKVSIPRSGSMYTTWDGHPAVVINVADPSYLAEAKDDRTSLSQVIFGAATDELFHSWQQDHGTNTGPAMRGTEYPMAVTPRLYRAMLYDDLVAAYNEPGQRRQHLAAAAYWNDRWHKQFPAEVKRAAPTDAAEGTAGYFDAVAGAVAEGADRTDHADIRKRSGYEPLGRSLDPRQVTVDGEAAPLGAVAGLLLDETKKDWKKQATHSGQAPADILLAGVAPVAEQPSDQLRQSIQDVLAKQNSDLVPRLSPLLHAYKNPSRALLYVPLNSATGDLDAGGYFTAETVPYAILPRLTGTFRLAGGTLSADEATVFAGTAGGHQYVIVPVDTSRGAAHLSGGRLRLDTAALKGDFQVTERDGKGGRRHLIAR